MTFHYNRGSEKKKRRELRNNPTPAEKVLWQYLRAKQLDGFKFRRQYSIDAFVVDFYCPKVKLAIEIDGDSHLKDRAVEYDFDREKHIEKFGVSFLRFTNDEIYDNIEGVLLKISDKAGEFKHKRG